MASQLAGRAGILRHLNLGDVLSRPSRVISVQNQLRQLSLSSAPRLTTSRVGVLATITTQQSNGFATQTTSPKTKKATDGKRKSTAAKKETKPKPKRELTEKQKEAKAKKAERDSIKQLKETALQAPKKLSQRAHTLALQAKLPEVRDRNKSQNENFAATVKFVKQMPSYEFEPFKLQAEQNRASNEAAYSSWILSHTPTQIKDANLARRRLAKKIGKPCVLLKDDRLVKRPLSSYMIFARERIASGDFKHLQVADISGRASNEWKNLTASEKERFHKLAIQDRERYVHEHQDVYGVPPKKTKLE
ncbi:hypothetical protein N7493_000640 [Penicillium malachiteum]|uniref:HMG box domain-containing protein n=1 Tax=Penicillium malachiteum TaxID=1324776 RepID=A0AAD6HWQ6_9EURO|nr:hypothetical protein N7493_000640 [Penicillium malachiteum]